MKKVKLSLFFLWDDKANDFLETEQTREENGSAVDGKGDGESNQPIDVQLFDKECNSRYCEHEKDDMEPITTIHLEL